MSSGGSYAVGLQYAVKKYWQGNVCRPIVCLTNATVGRATALPANYVPARYVYLTVLSLSGLLTVDMCRVVTVCKL